MKLYIVFQTTKTVYDYRNEKHLMVEPEFQGAFDSLEEALKMCKNDLWWVGVAKLNIPFPDDPVEWDECYDYKGSLVNSDGEVKK